MGSARIKSVRKKIDSVSGVAPSRVEGTAPPPNKRGDASEFSKKLRLKKRGIVEDIIHPQNKTAPYNIIKVPTDFKEREKARKQFVDHIYSEDSRPSETREYIKKYDLKPKPFTPKSKEREGFGTGADTPNLAAYTKPNAERWAKSARIQMARERLGDKTSKFKKKKLKN